MPSQKFWANETRKQVRHAFSPIAKRRSNTSSPTSTNKKNAAMKGKRAKIGDEKSREAKG